MAKLLPSVYKCLFDRRFSEVYLKNGSVADDDMAVASNEVVKQIMEYGRGINAAKRNLRELQSNLRFVVEDPKGTIRFVHNPYGVPLSDLIATEVEDTVIISVNRRKLNEGSAYDASSVITKNGEILSNICCYAMRHNLENGRVKHRSNQLSIFGTKIIVCPWCGKPVNLIGH